MSARPGSSPALEVPHDLGERVAALEADQRNTAGWLRSVERKLDDGLGEVLREVREVGTNVTALSVDVRHTGGRIDALEDAREATGQHELAALRAKVAERHEHRFRTSHLVIGAALSLLVGIAVATYAHSLARTASAFSAPALHP